MSTRETSPRGIDEVTGEADTEAMTTTENVIVECKCVVCGGRRAQVPVALKTLAATAQGRHGLVHVAHDPNAVTGAAARRRTGVVAL